MVKTKRIKKNLNVFSFELSPSLPVQSLSEERKMGIRFLREHVMNTGKVETVSEERSF